MMMMMIKNMSMEMIHVFIMTSGSGNSDHVELVFADNKENAINKLHNKNNIKKYDGSIPLSLFVERIKDAKKVFEIDKSATVMNMNESVKLDITKMIAPEIQQKNDEQLIYFAQMLKDKVAIDNSERKILDTITQRLEEAVNKSK